MSKNYYYLIAGMPEVGMDDAKTVCSMEQLRAEYYPELTPADRKLTDLLWLEQDNRNLLSLLSDRDATIEQEGLYTADELRDMVRAAREDEKWNSDYPTYLRDFIRTYYAESTEAGPMAADVLSSYYYKYAMQADNRFVSRWFGLNLDLNNILTAMTARKYKLPVAQAVIGDGEVAEALRTNNSRDFGLAGSFDRMEEIQHIAETGNLVEREHKIDALRWGWLEDESFFDYFGVEKLFAFLVKNQIVARWLNLDAEVGSEMLRSMVAEMQNVDVPEEYRMNRPNVEGFTVYDWLPAEHRKRKQK